MIVDANILLHAANRDAPLHVPANRWLTDSLNGAVRIGLPWLSLGAFLRIATHPRAMPDPFSPDQAMDVVDAWLQMPAAWVPEPSDGYPALLSAFVRRHGITGNLIPDAFLATLAAEHGVAVASTDTDFARWPEIGWVNPLNRSL